MSGWPRRAALVCLFLIGAAPAAVEGGYCTVVSRATLAEPAWCAVVDALTAKYGAETVTWAESVTEARAALAVKHPRYCGFVARPEEAGRRFVVAVHRLTRALDDDPYGDCLWGILTGYEAADALRMVRAEPLTVRRGLGGTAIPLDVIGEGVWFDEGRRNHMVVKPANGKAADQPGPDDPAERIVELLNTARPDVFITSGHATERDWQIGYSYPAGSLRCRDGVLLGVPRDQLKVVPVPGSPNARRIEIAKAFAVNSPNPKVHLGVGNCLIGHLSDRQAMAAALLHSGGVNQMAGYTVVSWYGFMGWGLNDYFLGQAGRYNLAQAFFANQQALLARLETEFPGKPRLDLEEADYAANAATLNKVAAKLGYTKPEPALKDHLGLLWDRDTLAFYGDPAWDARLAPQALAFDQTLTTADGKLVVELQAKQDVTLGRPPLLWWPQRLVKGGEVVAGEELRPVVTDDFVLLAGTRKLVAGRTYRVEVRPR